ERIFDENPVSDETSSNDEQTEIEASLNKFESKQHRESYRQKQELRLSLYRRFHPYGRLKLV
ncbi:MAG: hypothetical protein NC911_10890, partial [Candidatus Omnitrophica bacterium]|nr:hypothetical protein [Candidatus Omnitrophota bacterium]